MYEIFERLCEEKGVTAYRVCKSTGITTATISNWKAGRYTPKQEKMQKIADYFGVSLEYLMTGKETDKKNSELTSRDEKDIKDILSNTEQLLKQDGLMFDGDPASPEAIDSILSAMKIGMEMAKKNTLQRNIKRNDIMDVKRLVDSLVRKYNTRNPFEIINNLNVIVVFYPLHGVKGFYQYFQRNNIIYIDESLSYHERLFVCAHELGHMLLHKKSNAIFMDSRTQLNTTKYELEANRFAMDLLIADNDIEEHLDFTTSQLSRLLGYNKKLIELRLRDFN